MKSLEISGWSMIIGLLVLVVILSFLVLELDSRVDKLIINQGKIITILESVKLESKQLTGLSPSQSWHDEYCFNTLEGC